MRIPLGFVAVTMLFVLYWVLVPDEDTPNAIKWLLIGEAVVEFIKWYNQQSK